MTDTMTSNHTGADPATLTVHGTGTFVASYGGARTRQRPRIAHDPLALAAAAEALNRGIVVELHPDDVVPALTAGMQLAQIDRWLIDEGAR